MTIGKVINTYGENYTPYVGNLVNHLPMAQLAIYKMTKDLRKVMTYSEYFLERANIDRIRDSYPNTNSLEEVLGKRDQYQACLDFIRMDLAEEDLDVYLNQILNKYILGLSSGLFHSSIRLAYAIEGLSLDFSLTSEVERALAYYVTAYRESKLFTRKIQANYIKEEMAKLVDDDQVSGILEKHHILGQKLKALYSEKVYMSKGFIIDGSPDDKINALLELLLPAYYYSGNIVTLHCITGLHAIIVLRDYFDDYSLALDILTTSILSHLLTTGYNDYNREIKDYYHISFDAILDVASEKTDVHTIKLAYTCSELKMSYNKKGLEEIAIKRIRNT